MPAVSLLFLTAARCGPAALPRFGGFPVIASQNAAQLNQIVTNMIEGVAAEEIGNSDAKK